MINLSKMIENGESEKIEFKNSLSLHNPIYTAISAFSNKNGGSILVGINDNKEVVGVSLGKNTLENLANEIQRNTDPHIFPTITVLKKNNNNVVIIEVEENEEKPVFFRDKAFIRVGKTNQKLSSSEIKRMILEGHSGVYWDEKICENALKDDIDVDKLKWFVNETNKQRNRDLDPELSIEETLSKLDLVKDGKLTNAAVLLFGKDPQRFVRQAEIQCGRFKGTKAIDFVDRKTFPGNIIDQRTKAIEFVKDHINLKTTIVGTERIDEWEYPIAAIRESITNCICHRNYKLSSNIQIRIFNDRLEFWGCGPLPEHLTVEDIKKPHNSHPRNPLIAKRFFDIKFIEHWGTGIERIIQSCLKAGLPKPIFEIKAGDFVVILNKYKITDEILRELNKRQQKAIDYLFLENRITNKEYRSINIGISRSTALNDLKELVDKGIIALEGSGPGAHYILV
ncbi:putative transcriptional regulator [Methanobacterium lacus]|uniref:Putative transcriptional regulator n=1 Tax=Methanobacterium lacus (strain AL-21) TaxID=877455 RepID=F0T5W9_METLA|nr:RNA-binding domain-containing protein [Methanobacterium lacus]ADZ09362.1 putative transcriptional regulator [Methanobacterium lacus]